MILMLVLMGSVSAVAQGLKIKKFSYAKSGETLRGEQLYARTIDSRSLEREQGYAPYSWILYLENGGTVQLELPDGQKHQVGLGKHSFTYNNGEDMYIDVRVVPYAVPYLGGLRLQGAVSDDNVHLEKTVSEEDFFTYTITSDASLMKTIKINPQGGHEIDGNLGIHAALTQKFPESGYKYAIRFPVEQERSFAAGVSVKSLRDMAVQQGLNPNDFVLQIGLDAEYGGIIFSEVYRDQARLTKKTTFLRIIDKRPQIKKVTLTTQISPVGAGSVLINGASQSSIQVDQGTQVRLEAQVASQEYRFDHWQDAAGQSLGTDSQLSYVVSNDQMITAVFKKKAEEKCTLTVKVEPEHVGKVLLDGKDQSSVTVRKGTHVRLKAEVVDQNYEFRGWKTAGQVSLGKQNPFDYPVAETETVIAIFEKKASTPQVGPVEINFGQREALLTWASGSATSWIVKVYQGEQVVFDQEIQTSQLMLVGLKPGEHYRYEIVAKMSGKLPSQAVQGSFRTDQFDVNDLLTPYLKNFSKIERNKSFPIILLDVDPRDFPQEMTVEAYSLDEREVKSSLTLRNDGKIYWMILPEGNAKALVFVLKSGSEIRYELTYDLSK